MNHFKLNTAHKEASGFIVPDNYFETLSDRLLPKLYTKSVPLLSLSNHIKQNKNWLTSVAAILLVSFSVLLYSNFQSQKNQKYTAELENYLTDHPNYSDDDIVNLLNTEEITALKIESTLNNETIENQLIDNGDLEEIITN